MVLCMPSLSKWVRCDPGRAFAETEGMDGTSQPAGVGAQEKAGQIRELSDSSVLFRG